MNIDKHPDTSAPRASLKAKLVVPADPFAVPDALLARGVVQLLTGLSTTQLYRLISQGRFPAPVKLSTRCARWRAGTLHEWIKSRV